MTMRRSIAAALIAAAALTTVGTAVAAGSPFGTGSASPSFGGDYPQNRGYVERYGDCLREWVPTGPQPGQGYFREECGPQTRRP